jgi:integrase
MRLHDAAGNRLYLNAEERAAFLAVARRRPARDRTLCETLHFTGCRASELLEITPARVDLSGGTITIRSLKKRKDASGSSKIVYRSVPLHMLQKWMGHAQLSATAICADAVGKEEQDMTARMSG